MAARFLPRTSRSDEDLIRVILSNFAVGPSYRGSKRPGFWFVAAVVPAGFRGGFTLASGFSRVSECLIFLWFLVNF